LVQWVQVDEIEVDTHLHFTVELTEDRNVVLGADEFSCTFVIFRVFVIVVDVAMLDAQATITMLHADVEASAQHAKAGKAFLVIEEFGNKTEYLFW
jgi:hypothetical protein